MAPIHDTDVAEERWAQAEWKNYELWEKVEHRLRRRKWLWICGTLALFMILSSVPVLMDRWPRWSSLRTARMLASQLNTVKREAALSGMAFRIRFPDPGKLAYVVEKSDSCAAFRDPSKPVTAVRDGTLEPQPAQESGGYSLIRPDQGEALEMPNLLSAFCYDPLLGSDLIHHNEAGVGGFAIIPAQDLESQRRDRVALLVLEGTLGEMSFE